ncbi:MAG: hypothetical protein CMJ32_09965 [Phycisphaerae bacterium]|nr:hypothetical protein [Phycisphaerae bacterium]
MNHSEDESRWVVLHRTDDLQLLNSILVSCRSMDFPARVRELEQSEEHVLEVHREDLECLQPDLEHLIGEQVEFDAVVRRRQVAERRFIQGVLGLMILLGLMYLVWQFLLT